MSLTFNCFAPSGIGDTISCRSGSTCTPDANGYIKNVASADVLDGQQAGCVVLGAPASAIAFHNAIDAGDFTTNLGQRGTSFTGITNTLKYTADRFFALGASTSSISVSQQANTTIAGFASALQFGRASANTDVNPIYMVQVFESLDSTRFQGLPVTLSFWAQAGPNFSGGTLTVQLVYGTGSNQSAANMVAGTWTNQGNVINSTQALTTTPTPSHMKDRRIYIGVTDACRMLPDFCWMTRGEILAYVEQINDTAVMHERMAERSP